MLEQWKAAAPSAPFRASAGQDIEWSTSRPSYTLASALKACRNGRLMMAFSSAELRDYFVLSYAGEDIRAEADGADEASTKPARVPDGTAEAAPVLTVDDACDAVWQATAAQRAAEDTVERLFNSEVDRLLTAGQGADAARLAEAMPACYLRDKAFQAIYVSGLPDHYSPFDLPVCSLDRQQAAALLAWRSSKNDCQRANDSLAQIAHPVLKDLLATQGRDQAMAFAESLAPGWTKANLLHCARYEEIPQEAAPQVDAGPSP